jgi:uncharacterized membrane protein YdjX (TVP38/TMEM64 family)
VSQPRSPEGQPDEKTPASAEGHAAGGNRKKLIVAAGVVVLLVVAGMLVMSRIPETVSAPLFVLVVVLEVIIAPLPGGPIGYMGAARYGFWTAWPLLWIGNVIGTTIAFLLARRFGAPLFEEHVAAKTRARYDALLGGQTALLWLVYALPIAPVDILSVLAGVSRMTARRFLLVAYTGFLLRTAIAAYLGSSLAEYAGMSGAMSIIGALFLIGVIVWLWKRQVPAS